MGNETNLESNRQEVTDDPVYYVLSAGMDIPDGRGNERHLNTGDSVKRSDLLAFTRAMYIDAWLKQGDLGTERPTPVLPIESVEEMTDEERAAHAAAEAVWQGHG